MPRLLLWAALFVAILTNPQYCEASIVAQWTAGNGHYYEYVPAVVTWSTAKLLAEQAGGHLVTFSDSNEHAFLLNTFPFASGWIGFTDEVVEGEWRWIDATASIWQDPVDFSTPIQTAFTAWGTASAPPFSNEPNGSTGENYAIFNTVLSGTWNDASAVTTESYFIEYEDGVIPGGGTNGAVPESASICIWITLLVSVLVVPSLVKAIRL